MSPAWATTIAFVCTTAFVCAAATTLYSLFFRYRGQLNERIERLRESKTGFPKGSLFKDEGTFSEHRGLSLWKRAESYFANAQLGYPFSSYVQASTAVALVCGLVTFLIARRWWAAPPGFAVGVSVAVLLVVHRRRRRKRALTAQLPKALDVISRAVQAGQSVPAAFQIVADDFASPIADEFRLCYEEQNLGIPHETALRNLARRTGIMGLQILVVGLLVQARSGGNLVELLDNLSSMVMKRLRLQDRVRALTGEGRMQAVVLIALPSAAFVVLLFIAPNYAATLLAHPSLLASSIVAQLVGAIWIRRCISFQY